MDENQIVRKIAAASCSQHRTKHPPAGLPLGIGDDAAIVHSSVGKDWVVTTDAFIERVHFLKDVHPANSVGYKALARATSDVAAMGGRPLYFLLTLAIPSNRTSKWLNAFTSGMNDAATAFEMRLIGGDTTKTDSVIISITVIGEIRRGSAVTRAGAKPGDGLYVSGVLGAAELGLQLALKRQIRGKSLQRYLYPHLYPSICLKLGQWLAQHRIPSAMIDLSDGLSTDLRRLCAASDVGAKLNAENIPRMDIPDSVAGLLGKRCDPLQLALHGGEDYQLLFTVPRHRESRILRAPVDTKITRIGEITTGGSVLLVNSDGSSTKLPARGRDPFRR